MIDTTIRKEVPVLTPLISYHQWQPLYRYEEHQPFRSPTPNVSASEPQEPRSAFQNASGINSKPLVSSAPQPPLTSNGAFRTRRERTRRENENLEAVSGVIVPSILALGQTPIKIEFQNRNNLILIRFCPICDSGFPKTDHLKSHITSCARRNGKPHDASWDDYLEDRIRKRGPRRGEGLPKRCLRNARA